MGTYYRGCLDDNRIVGWNGEGKGKYTTEIPDNIMTIKIGQKLFTTEIFTKDSLRPFGKR